MEWLFDDPAKIALAEIVKGWLFVALTSLLLYGLLRRRTDGVPRLEDVPPARRSRGLPFTLLAISVIAASGFGIAEVAKRARDKEAARLDVIADLKVRQIADWLKERQRNAEFVQGSIFFADQYRHWREADDPASEALLKTRLEQFCKSQGFSAVILLDPEGRRLWNSTGAPGRTGPGFAGGGEIGVPESRSSPGRPLPRRLGPTAPGFRRAARG